MSDFVQKVFEKLSLQKDPALWQSRDDSQTGMRIHFLSRFPEAGFEEHLLREKSPIAKNDILARVCSTKAQDEKNDEKKLALLNQALLFVSLDETQTMGDLIMARIHCLLRCDRVEECLKDLDLWVALADPLARKEHQQSMEKVRKKCLKLITKTKTKTPAKEVTREFFDAVQIESNPNCGRYVVATRDIQPGEQFALDVPICQMLQQEHVKHHCWHCLRRLTAPIPCSSCSGVGFCSLRCRNISAETYHRFECGRTDLLYKSNIGAWILAVRVIGTLPGMIDKSSNHLPGAWKDVMHLEAHEGSTQYMAPELMKEALVAVFLTRFLQIGGLLDPPSPDQGFERFAVRHLKLALTLHKIMRIIRFNCHESLTMPPITEVPSKIGFAINPCLAMINHSCDSNYGRVWEEGENGPVIHAYATRLIQKGEQVCDVYSDVFSQSPRHERQLVHARYHFTCRCSACVNDWALLKDLPKAIFDLPPSAYREEAVTGQLLNRLETTLKAVKANPMNIEKLKDAWLMAHNLLRDLEDNHRSKGIAQMNVVEGQHQNSLTQIGVRLNGLLNPFPSFRVGENVRKSHSNERHKLNVDTDLSLVPVLKAEPFQIETLALAHAFQTERRESQFFILFPTTPIEIPNDEADLPVLTHIVGAQRKFTHMVPLRMPSVLLLLRHGNLGSESHDAVGIGPLHPRANHGTPLVTPQTGSCEHGEPHEGQRLVLSEHVIREDFHTGDGEAHLARLSNEDPSHQAGEGVLQTRISFGGALDLSTQGQVPEHGGEAHSERNPELEAPKSQELVGAPMKGNIGSQIAQETQIQGERLEAIAHEIDLRCATPDKGENGGKLTRVEIRQA
eukprot:maker-scaffold954_size76946-snap-gene-0.18 protein:Tk12145 transcript:maker-scaffold954_size76946-snap-gene-0.18-mRNA-1 annotation:"GD10796"